MKAAIFSGAEGYVEHSMNVFLSNESRRVVDMRVTAFTAPDKDMAPELVVVLLYEQMEAL